MNRRRRGVVLLAALLLVPLVAVALAAIGAAISADARRGKDQSTQAQLDQLLIAGSFFAKDQLSHAQQQTGKVKVELPSTLTAQSADVTVELLSRSDQSATFRIAAQIDAQSATEDVTFSAAGMGWTATVVQANTKVDENGR